MRNTFHHRYGNNREHRLIHQRGPEFGNQPLGMPSYEQLLYHNQQMAKRLQSLEQQFFNLQIATPLDAQNLTARRSLAEQQSAWNRMGGQFPLGASPPQFYANIGTRARYWNQQMQNQQQYGNNAQVNIPFNSQHSRRRRGQPPAPSQPEYLNGLGRNPDPPPPAPRRGRRVEPRGPRRGGGEPLTQPVIEFDDQGNPMLVQPVSTAYRPSNQHQMLTGDWLMRNERTGKTDIFQMRTGQWESERLGGRSLNIRSEEVRKVFGMLRAMSQFLSPEERRMIETTITSFEQLMVSVERMESAARRGNLQEAQASARDVETRLRGLWTILPQDIRKVVGGALRKQGLLSGTEPIGGNFALIWNIDSNFTAPTVQVRQRTPSTSSGQGGNDAPSGRTTGNTSLNNRLDALIKHQNEALQKGSTDGQTKLKDSQAKLKEQSAALKTLQDQLKKTQGERSETQERLKSIQANIAKLQAERSTFQKDTMAQLQKLQADRKAGIGDPAAMEKSIDDLTTILTERLPKMNEQIDTLEIQSRSLTSAVDRLIKQATALQQNIAKVRQTAGR